jgi:hypothetical protein
MTAIRVELSVMEKEHDNQSNPPPTVRNDELAADCPWAQIGSAPGGGLVLQ